MHEKLSGEGRLCIIVKEYENCDWCIQTLLPHIKGRLIPVGTIQHMKIVDVGEDE